MIIGVFCGAVKRKQTPAIVARSVVDQRTYDFIVAEFVRVFILVKNIVRVSVGSFFLVSIFKMDYVTYI